MSDISFSMDRAKEVFPALLEAYYGKKGLFSEEVSHKYGAIFPETLLPDGVEPGSVEHIVYLFFITQLDKRAVSDYHYSEGRRLFTEHPEMANPEYIATAAMHKLTKLVEDYLHTSTPFVRIGHIQKNFARIAKDLEGNPLNAVKGTGDVHEARKIMQSFQGYGRARSSLFLTQCIRSGLISFPNQHELQLKIDAQDIQICFATEIMQFEGRRKHHELTAPLSGFISEYCLETGTNVFDLDSILRAIGSKICVKQNPSLCYDLCPAEPYCVSNMPRSHYNAKDRRMDASTDIKLQQLHLDLRTT